MRFSCPRSTTEKDQGEREKSVRDEEEKERERLEWGQEGDRGKKMNHVQTLLIPRELYCSSSKESVSEMGITTLLTVRDGKRGLENTLVSNIWGLFSCLASVRTCFGVFMGGLGSWL